MAALSPISRVPLNSAVSSSTYPSATAPPVGIHRPIASCTSANTQQAIPSVSGARAVRAPTPLRRKSHIASTNAMTSGLTRTGHGRPTRPACSNSETGPRSLNSASSSKVRAAVVRASAAHPPTAIQPAERRRLTTPAARASSATHAKVTADTEFAIVPSLSASNRPSVGSQGGSSSGNARLNRWVATYPPHQKATTPSSSSHTAQPASRRARFRAMGASGRVISSGTAASSVLVRMASTAERTASSLMASGASALSVALRYTAARGYLAALLACHHPFGCALQLRLYVQMQRIARIASPARPHHRSASNQIRQVGVCSGCRRAGHTCIRRSVTDHLPKLPWRAGEVDLGAGGADGGLAAVALDQAALRGLGLGLDRLWIDDRAQLGLEPLQLGG